MGEAREAGEGRERNRCDFSRPIQFYPTFSLAATVLYEFTGAVLNSQPRAPKRARGMGAQKRGNFV